MGVRRIDYDGPLSRAVEHSLRWLDSVETRPVRSDVDADQVVNALPSRLPDLGADPGEVVDLLARVVDPGLTAMASGRFFGFVIGGTQPAALAADWLVSAWDQNAALRLATPGVAALEEVAAHWLLELFGLPSAAGVGFVTGATMANFTCLAAARSAVLAGVGWDDGRRGLCGAPRIHVLVGEERHETVDLALRYLGLGAPTPVPADAQGRVDVGALAQALDEVPRGEPVIVVLQAGNLHSGAFDDFSAICPIVDDRGGWVHVDGAFGMWATASPRLRHLARGVDQADSWATDAHKTLNTPYDCGLAVVRDEAALRAAMSLHAAYLPSERTGRGEPHHRVPELSRRARGIPVLAALLALGREGVAELVERLVQNARDLATTFATVAGTRVLNDVVFTQVCLEVGDDAKTDAVEQLLLSSGKVWISRSRWHDRAVLRVSMSNWSTDSEDILRAAHAVREAVLASG